MSYAAALQIIGGIVANRAARRESKALEKQGNLSIEESEIAAQRQQREGQRMQARQSLAFLKSGVSLIGSPLLVLQDTQKEANFQAEATRRSGAARRRLLRDTARNVRTRGAAGIFTSVGSAAGTMGTNKKTNKDSGKKGDKGSDKGTK